MLRGKTSSDWAKTLWEVCGASVGCWGENTYKKAMFEIGETPIQKAIRV